MQQALETGTRTIMLDSGRILLDMDQTRRRELTVDKLRELYVSAQV